MTVKARKPGISLRLWRIPISAPVKSTFSIAKLFSKLSHTAQLIAGSGMAVVSLLLALNMPSKPAAGNEVLLGRFS